jgi:acetolactate decarboxylase
MKNLYHITSILLLSASAVCAAARTYDVSWQGSLQAVHGGDVSGKVPLQQFKDKKNLYAVGPAAGLDGEITVIGGKIYVTRVRHGELITDKSFSASASFLVWSEVAAWQQPVPLGTEVRNLAQFEKQIEALAGKVGIDTSTPFPFTVEGVFEWIDYHVLVPETDQQTHAAQNDGAKKMSVKMADAEIVGFFSKNHQGVFTHKGSVAHLHVVEPNGNSGHVDQIVAAATVRVSFPQ